MVRRRLGQPDGVVFGFVACLWIFVSNLCTPISFEQLKVYAFAQIRINYERDIHLIHKKEGINLEHLLGQKKHQRWLFTCATTITTYHKKYGTCLGGVLCAWRSDGTQ